MLWTFPVQKWSRGHILPRNGVDTVAVTGEGEAETIWQIRSEQGHYQGGTILNCEIHMYIDVCVPIQ